MDKYRKGLLTRKGCVEPQNDVKIGFQFSTRKTKAMLFSRKRIDEPSSLKTGEAQIQFVKNLKILEVIFDPKLSFENHILSIIKECLNILKAITCEQTKLLLTNRALIRTKMDMPALYTKRPTRTC